MTLCPLISPIRTAIFSLAVFLCLQANPVFSAGWDDNDRYPNVQKFLQELDLSKFPAPKFAATPWWCNTPRAVEVPEEKIEEFFLIGAKDGITIIRLFSLMAVAVREQGIALCGAGEVLGRVIQRHNLNLGMSLPMNNIAVYSWIPVDDPKDPYDIARSIIVYREPYLHKVPHDVMPADIKVGTGQMVPYEYGENKGSGALVTIGFHVSSNKVGFENIHGLGALLHGPLGVMTKMMPFIPDDIHHLYLEQGTLFARALIAKEIPHFEEDKRNQLHFNTVHLSSR